MNDKVKIAAADVCPLFKEYGSCERCDEEIDIDDEPCIYQCMAKLFLEKDYRKASVVVDEFVEHLKEKAFSIPTVYNSHFCRMVDAVAEELKNKYTEDGK